MADKNKSKATTLAGHERHAGRTFREGNEICLRGIVMFKGVLLGVLVASLALNWALLTGRLIQPEQDYLMQIARTRE